MEEGKTSKILSWVLSTSKHICFNINNVLSFCYAHLFKNDSALSGLTRLYFTIFFLRYNHDPEPKWWELGGVFREERICEWDSPEGEWLDMEGSRLTVGSSAGGAGRMVEATGMNEEVKRRNCSLVWDMQGSWGWVEAYLGEIPRVQLEIQAWSSRERLIELRCSNYLMIWMREESFLLKFVPEMVGYFSISYGHPSCDWIHSWIKWNLQLSGEYDLCGESTKGENTNLWCLITAGEVGKGGYFSFHGNK